MLGYIVGYSTGRWDGCGEIVKGAVKGNNPASENDPLHRCRHQGPDFSKNTSYFVNALTEFYTHYPGDRELDIGEVLEQLGSGLTLEEVHNHPFPRHSPTTEKR